MARWTQDQAVSFEAARECLTDMMGICSAAIADEESKASPDAKRLAQLEGELSSLAQERLSLTIEDAERTEAIRKTYGAFVRACRQRSAPPIE